MVGALVLAAGRGERLGGRPKALLPIGGQTFLEAIWRSGREGGVGEWRIVIGGPHTRETEREAARLGLPCVFNPVASEGMATSIGAGFAEAGRSFESGAALLWPVDHPAVLPATIAALAAAADEGGVVIPCHRGRRGHPPLVGRARWRDFEGAAALPEGARSVLRRLESVLELAVDDPGVVRDVDVPSDLSDLP